MTAPGIRRTSSGYRDIDRTPIPEPFCGTDFFIILFLTRLRMLACASVTGFSVLVRLKKSMPSRVQQLLD